MLLHICQVTSDNIPVRSSFPSWNKGRRADLHLKNLKLFWLRTTHRCKLQIVTVLRVPLSLNIEDGKWARSKVNAYFTSVSVQPDTRRWNIRSEFIEELTVLTEFTAGICTTLSVFLSVSVNGLNSSIYPNIIFHISSASWIETFPGAISPEATFLVQWSIPPWIRRSEDILQHKILQTSS